MKNSTTRPIQVAGLLGVLLLSGCAYNDHQGANCEAELLTDQQKTNCQVTGLNGIRYYKPAHFLLVYSDGNDGHVVELLTLPDTTQIMSVDPVAWFATNDTTMEFKNGMLASAVESVDSTTIPKTVIAAAKDLAIANAKAFRTAEDSKVISVPAPYLFKIVYDNGWKLQGGQGEISGESTLNIKASNPGSE